MIDIHALVELNHDVIVFAYGLSFFVLGVAIALQSRQHSRLDFARSLPWLAAFGMMHGVYEWGDLFVPIQAVYLGAPVISGLRVVQIFLLAGSFGCLLQFAERLWHPSGRWLTVYLAAPWLFIVWVIFALLTLMASAFDVMTWFPIANALARYGLGFPGAGLSAYALWRHTEHRIAPLDAPHIVRMLRIAVAALAFYAIIGGLIPPPVPFFPGTWVNTATFNEIVDLPPSVFRSLTGIVLAVSIIRALDIFDLETSRFIQGMERQQILAAERVRLARDLHDNIIQKVYAVGLLIQSAQAETTYSPALSERMTYAISTLHELIHDLRRQLDDLHPAPVGGTLSQALREIAEDPRLRALVEVSLDLDIPEEHSLSPQRGEDVLAIVREALSNVVRHSHAEHVRVSICQRDGRLCLAVEDNGNGLPEPLIPGLGLRNIDERARLLGGQAHIANVAEKGTRLELDIPWRDVR